MFLGSFEYYETLSLVRYPLRRWFTLYRPSRNVRLLRTITAVCRGTALGRTRHQPGQASGNGGRASPQGAGDATELRRAPCEAVRGVPER